MVNQVQQVLMWLDVIFKRKTGVFFVFIITFLVSVVPIIHTNFSGVYFVIDPAAMYLGNALSFIKAHQISYIDHPGTPAIVLISTYLLPIRLISKFYFHQNSLIWIFSHLDLVYLYCRIFQAAIAAVGVTIIMRTVYRVTTSSAAAMLVWVLIISYSTYLYTSIDISAEALSIFLVAISLRILVSFMFKPDPMLLCGYGFICGLALANRFTTLGYLLAVGGLTVFIPQVTKFQKILNGFMAVVFVCGGFVLGTWPIRFGYVRMANWIWQLLTHPGLHGNGDRTIFDLYQYRDSLLTLFRSDPLVVSIILIGIVTILKVKLGKVSRINLGMSLGIFLVCYLLFSKYPLPHYQVPNVIALITFSIILLAKTNKWITTVFLLVALVVAPGRINLFWRNIQTEWADTEAVDHYVQARPVKMLRVWEWGRQREFAALWGNSWSGFFTSGEVAKVFDKSAELLMPDTFRTPGNYRYLVSQTCFDQLVIQSESLRFVKLPVDTTVEEIPNTHMSFVSWRCPTKP